MSMTDEERIKMISQSYMNLEVNKKILVNRQTYGYVSKIIDNKKVEKKFYHYRRKSKSAKAKRSETDNYPLSRLDRDQ